MKMALLVPAVRCGRASLYVRWRQSSLWCGGEPYGRQRESFVGSGRKCRPH